MSDTSHKGRSWVAFDWDRTVCYYSTWEDMGVKIGKPIRPIVARIQLFLAEDKYDVKIFTARACDANWHREQDLAEIRRLCKEWFGRELEITCQKDFGCVAIYDDIAVPVMRNTGLVVLPDDHSYWAFVPKDPLVAFAGSSMASESALADMDDVVEVGMQAEKLLGKKAN